MRLENPGPPVDNDLTLQDLKSPGTQTQGRHRHAFLIAFQSCHRPLVPFLQSNLEVG